jgi:preprotein translocase subunit YajC
MEISGLTYIFIAIYCILAGVGVFALIYYFFLLPEAEEERRYQELIEELRKSEVKAND